MKVIKKIIIGIVFVFLFMPSINAQQKVVINLFHSSSCPHCKDEIKWLKNLESKYEIKYYEVYNNLELYNSVVEKLDVSSNGVPLTIIGSDYLIGYSESMKDSINDIIKKYEKKEYCDVVELIKSNKDIKKCISINSKLKYNSHIKNIPLLGKVNVKEASLPIITIILGTIDGFNPCAMWVLIFLITMLMNMKNKKRMWILGLTFLITSSIVYMLFMFAFLKISLSLINSWFKYVIALIAITGGLFNLYNYLKTRKKDSGCTVTNNSQRKRIITKIQHIIREKSFIIAFIGIILLAASVNLLELACSTVFPFSFVQILSLNNLSNIEYILYIITYTLFFMIDDIIVFTIAMLTLKVTGISNKYTKYSHLIGGIIMIIIGLLMIFKMDYLMFNF